MMKTKNIIIISCSIVYMDARVRSYIDGLCKQGYHVDVISLKDDKNERIRSQENGYINYKVATRYIGDRLISYILYYILFLLRSFAVVSLLSFRKKFHAVHYNNLPNFPVFAALLPRIMGAKIILDNHDLITSVFASKFQGRRLSSFSFRLLSFEQKLSMAFAHHVICADHNQKDALVEVGVPAHKITVILNLANEAWFRPERKERTDNEFRLIYHGTVAERLGLDVAIRAVALAREQIPEIRFHLIGNGDFLDTCLKLIQELDLERVVLPSKCFYPVETLSDIINTMDVGLVPNRRTKGTDEYMLPVKLLEYVYMRMPVIAPRLKIIERYFDEDMLMFFEPGDHEDLARCICELYQHKERRCSLVQKSQNFVQEHNWSSQMEKYLHLIEN